MSGYPLPRWLVIALPVGVVVIILTALSLAQKTATLVDGDRTLTLHTQASTVRGAIESAGIALYPEDLLQPSGDTPLDSGAVITLTRALPVQVLEGGETVYLRTHQQKIAAILAEAGRTLSPADAIYADGLRLAPGELDVATAVPYSIRVQRAAPIMVVDGGQTHSIVTNALTVGQALIDAGIVTYLADGVTPPLEAAIAANLTITIDRSLPVTIEADGQTLSTRTHRATVAEVLTDAGLLLVGLDTTVPALSDPPPIGGTPIRLVRVVEQIVTTQAALPYETQVQPLPELDIDNTQLIQEGKHGAQSQRVRVRYENGAEVSRTVEEAWVSVAPQPRIVGYGTNIVIRTVDTADGPMEYWRAVRMYATSYSASRAGTPRSAPWYGLTRSGKVLTKGMVAIDLKVMPLGTRLYVSGYGLATAEDTGGGVKGKWIDLGYDDWNYVSWHQYLTVYFLTPIPPADQIKWILP